MKTTTNNPHITHGQPHIYQTSTEKVISHHWIDKGDTAILFRVLEETYNETQVTLCSIAAYTKLEDGLAYGGAQDFQVGNLKILTSLTGRWKIEEARNIWRVFTANGWGLLAEGRNSQ